MIEIFVLFVKPVPVTVTVVPGAALVGEKPVIVSASTITISAGLKVNDLGRLLAVIVIGPRGASDGTADQVTF